MSASREKQNRQTQAASGWVAPKTAREAQQRREERRSALLYGTIGLVFLGVVIASLIWNSNIIQRSATAVTIDGQKYTAGQVGYYYRNAYVGFVNQYSYLLSYMGLNTSTSLDKQFLTENASTWLDAEEGISWREYFMNAAIDQLSAMHAGLKKADEENFVYPDSVQTSFDETMDSMRTAARSIGSTVGTYLKNLYGSVMTEKIYRTELLRSIQYTAYCEAYEDSLTYTEEDLEKAYEEDSNSYDQVSYEVVTIDAALPEPEETAEGTEAEAAEVTEAAPVEGTEAEDAEGTEAAPVEGTEAEEAEGTEAAPVEGAEAAPASGEAVEIPDGDTPAAEASEITATEAAEAPAETPVEEAAEAPAETPVEEAAEAPAETPVEEAAEAPAETPVEETAEAPAEIPVEEAAEAPAETPVEETAEAPAETPVEEAAETDGEPTDAPMLIAPAPEDTETTGETVEATEETAEASEGDTAEDGETPEEEEPAVSPEQQAAIDAAKEAAEALLTLQRGGGNLSELSANVEKASYSQDDGASYNGTALSEWLFDPARKAGDTGVIESGTTVYAVVFRDRFRDESATVDVRHLLVRFEEGDLEEGDDGYEMEQQVINAAAQTRAEELYAQWQEGDATEDSFAALVAENTDDEGSKETGGLYEQIASTDSYVQTFLDWCFADGRKTGDSGIIESDYGYHVMYFVGEDIPVWQKRVTDDLRDKDYDAWFQGLADSVEVVRNLTGLSLI